MRLKVYEAIYRSINVKDLEDIYQRLVEQPWESDDEESFPLVYKVEIMNEMFLNFDDFGHISRSQKILSKFEDLVEKYPEDSNIGMLYIDCLLSQGVEMSIFSNPNIDDYIDKVTKIEQKYNFSQEILEYNEFKKNKVLADYYSSHKNDKGFSYIENMIKYAMKVKKIYIINCTQDQIMGYGMKYVDEFEPKVLMLESLVDSLLEGQKDKEKNLAYIHSGIMNLIKKNLIRTILV